jgi:hypothetical protein
MQIKPRKGTLLIWDANYQHMVPEQSIDEPRIMIAGNINYHTETLEPQEVINA